MIDRGAKVSLKRQTELLNPSRSSVYYTPQPLSDRDLMLMQRIDQLHLELPFYGSHKFADRVQREDTKLARRCYQPGRQGSMDRQRVHRGAMEERQIRGDLLVRVCAYTNGTEDRTSLTRYFRTYNAVRSHQYLEYRTPDEVYFGEPAIVTSMAA